MTKELDYIADLERENRLVKSFLYCTTKSCNNCGKVNCENFQRQRTKYCENWVSYKDYIKELEQENAELRKNGFTVSAMTEQQLKVAIEKGERLEKENAELKMKIYGGGYEMIITKKDADIILLEKQLTKAKEIIKRLKSLIEDVCDINYLSKNNTKLLEQTEQFLKEIEK